MRLEKFPTALGSFVISAPPPPTSDDISDDISDDNTPLSECRILQLLPELLQTITEYLNVHDIISLSRTCQTFYTLINDDNFWIHRIGCQFHPSIAHLYTFDLFQQPEYIQTHDEPRPSGFNHKTDENEIDQLGRNSATRYNDEAVARHHAKMYVSKEDFLQKVRYFQYSNDRENDCNIPFMKLIYFYLLDRKRTAIVDMSVIHRNDHYLVEREDEDSLKGRIIELQQVCWLQITGQFEYDIMPGKYQVLWRMKCSGNYVQMLGETEFIVVPSHGKLLIRNLSDNDFRTYGLEHNDQWFLVNIGEIIIYEPSKVLMAIRNWIDLNWKTGISWDCIELKLIP